MSASSSNPPAISSSSSPKNEEIVQLSQFILLNPVNSENQTKQICFPPAIFSCRFSEKPIVTNNSSGGGFKAQTYKNLKWIDGSIHIEPLKVRLVESEESFNYRKEKEEHKSETARKLKNFKANSTSSCLPPLLAAQQQHGQRKVFYGNNSNSNNKMQSSSALMSRTVFSTSSVPVPPKSSSSATNPNFVIHAGFWWVLKKFYPKIISSSRVLPFATFWKTKIYDPDCARFPSCHMNSFNNTSCAERRNREVDNDDENEISTPATKTKINVLDTKYRVQTQWDEELEGAVDQEKQVFRLLINKHFVEIDIEEKPKDLSWHFIFASVFKCEVFAQLKEEPHLVLKQQQQQQQNDSMNNHQDHVDNNQNLKFNAPRRITSLHPDAVINQFSNSKQNSNINRTEFHFSNANEWDNQTFKNEEIELLAAATKMKNNKNNFVENNIDESNRRTFVRPYFQVPHQQQQQETADLSSMDENQFLFNDNQNVDSNNNNNDDDEESDDEMLLQDEIDTKDNQLIRVLSSSLESNTSFVMDDNSAFFPHNNPFQGTRAQGLFAKMKKN